MSDDARNAGGGGAEGPAQGLRPTPSQLADWQALRRALHAAPELGYREVETAATVAARLRAAGLTVQTGIAGTGVVAILEGAAPGRTLVWRADMDALPVSEETGLPWSSTRAGVMHACGHDVHTAVGIGVAELLAAHRAALRGRRVFVFQPNEEGAPGAGLSGADAMLEAGVLADEEVAGVLALHCLPGLGVGRLGYSRGAAWAGSDRFLVEVRGRSTHGAYPHEGRDPVVAASQLVLALQTVASREVDGREACVLSVCRLEGGQQFNVIPERVVLEGILRTLSDTVREQAVAAVHRISQGIAAATGCAITLSMHRGAAPTVNDGPLLDAVLGVLSRVAPSARLVALPAQMGSEDFASFSQRWPSAYLMLGICSEDPGEATLGREPLHSPRFTIDERAIGFAIEAAARLLAALA